MIRLFMPNLFGQLTINAPTDGQYALANISMNAAVGPIGWPGHIAMLHGIVVDVINMVFIIPYITDAVLPKSTLPYCLFLFM